MEMKEDVTWYRVRFGCGCEILTRAGPWLLDVDIKWRCFVHSQPLSALLSLETEGRRLFWEPLTNDEHYLPPRRDANFPHDRRIVEKADLP